MNALARTLARLHVASEMEGGERDEALAALDEPTGVEKHSGESERPHSGAPKAKEAGYVDTSWQKPDEYEFPRFAFERQHGRDSEAGANKPKKHAEAKAGDGNDYAAWACSLLNQILRAGGKDEAERAGEALAESLDAAGWAVAFDPRRGRYIAAPSERDPAFDEFAERAPKGGTSINGKAYRGGMFIPSSAIKEAEQKAASGDEKAKQELSHLKSGKAAESARLEKRGPVDREKLAAKLKHDGTDASPLQGYHARQAAASARALFAHHGDLALHRIDEIADAVRSAMDKTEDPEEKARLGQRLAGLAVALEHVGGVKGVTGERGAKPAPEEEKPAAPASAVKRGRELSSVEEGDAAVAKRAADGDPQALQVMLNDAKYAVQYYESGRGDMDDATRAKKIANAKAMVETYRHDLELAEFDLKHNRENYETAAIDHLADNGVRTAEQLAGVGGMTKGHAQAILRRLAKDGEIHRRANMQTGQEEFSLEPFPPEPQATSAKPKPPNVAASLPLKSKLPDRKTVIDATPEEEAAAGGGLADLPPGVRSSVEWAAGKIKDRHEAIKQGGTLDKTFKGEGRYTQEVADKTPIPKDAVERLKQFIGLAAKNGIDPHKAMAEAGLTPEVLKDYPDLAPRIAPAAPAAAPPLPPLVTPPAIPPSASEPHEMSRAEFNASPHAKPFDPAVRTSHTHSTRQYGAKKPWLARVTGTSAKYGLAQDFINGTSSKGGMRRDRIDHEWDVDEPGLYRTGAHGFHGDEGEHFVMLPDGKGGMTRYAVDGADAVKIARGLERGLPLHEAASKAGFTWPRLARLAAAAKGQSDPFAHKAAVEDALKAGKAVPPPVIAEYPDLAAKYPPKA